MGFFVTFHEYSDFFAFVVSLSQNNNAAPVLPGTALF